MLVLNTPHNPTGAVFSRETLEAAADVAYRHGLLVLSDEIYARIVFGQAEHVSPATIERVAGQTILVSGFSKTYAMTGWRLGYVVAPRELIDVMIRVHQYTTVCATSFAQAGAVAALNGSQDCVREMVQEFERRRQVIVEAFENMPGASLVPPQGSFYAFPNLGSLGVSSVEVARRLLEDADVAVVPGSAFGDTGEGHVRISFACSLSDVRRGMNNLRQFCAAGAAHHPSGPAARPPRRS
jgi:aspartate/methionine/tyrosine aminotransferase